MIASKQEVAGPQPAGLAGAAAGRAPIAVFAYRRRRSLARALDALERCPEFSESPVFIYSDGPKTPALEGEVRAVRDMVAARLRSNMTLVPSDRNRGLAGSIIAGVTDLTARFGRAIVIEDDLTVSPAALAWFNAALDRYADEPRVMQISAHAFRAPAFRDRDQAMFLPFSTTWGWATWDRAWKAFDPTAAGWREALDDAQARRRFDLDGAYPYAEMLKGQMESGRDSWGILFYWSLFRAGGLTLFPPRPLLRNDGVDLKATHGMRSLLLANLRAGLRPVMRTVPSFPAAVAVEPAAFDAVRRAIAERRL